MGVYTSTFTVTGLTSDRYLIQNPIWIDIKEIPSDVRYMRVTLSPVGFAGDDVNPAPEPVSIRLRPHNQVVYFDLARWVRGMLPSPAHPTPLVDGMSVPNNVIKVQVKVASVLEDLTTSETRTFTKTFVRGGRWNRKSNLSIAAGTVLKVTDKIPYWPGYPVAKYTLNSAGTIIYNSIVAASLLDKRRPVGCNPVYMRFLNRDGGYSFWLFESYQLRKKTDKTTAIERRGVLRTTGNEPSYTLELRGRVEREYYQLMRSLAESPEVAIYQLEDLLIDNAGGLSFSGDQFTTVVNPGQNIDTPGESQYEDIRMSFEVRLTHNPLVKW